MSYDIIIIGGGVNALTAASYLAKSGKKVALVVAEDQIGGTCAKHEFHPGFYSPGVLNDTSMFRDWIVKDLNLMKHGLTYKDRSKTMAMSHNQKFIISDDLELTISEIEKISPTDAKRFREMKSFYAKVKKPISEFLNNTPPDIVDPQSSDMISLMKRGFQLRKLGKKDMLEVLRIAPMTIYDWLDEWFENDGLKAALALPAVTESYSAPWSPGTNANMLIHEVTKGKHFKGDGLSLIKALESSARDLGVDFKSDSNVAKVYPGKGVDLKNGETIECKTIVSAIDPKRLFLEMVDANQLNHKFEQRMVNFRSRGLTSQLLLAVDQIPELEEGVNRIIIADDLDYIEKAFDPIKYDEVTSQPALELYFPNLDHDDMAPEGKAVISVMIHYTPYDIKNGWDDEVRSELSKNVIDLIDNKLPGVAESIVGQSLLTPLDIETRYGLSGGQRFEGEHALDQLLIRPTPECAQYKTPFEGLYLCSGGSFPGGGLIGAPAALASKMIK